MARRCPKGKIERKGYTTKKGTRVKPTCITDEGLPGKTPKAKRWLPRLGPKPLGGWKTVQKVKTRHEHLRKQSLKKGCRKLLRTMTAIANVTTKGSTERRLREDYKWVEAQGWCHLKKKEKLAK